LPAGFTLNILSFPTANRPEDWPFWKKGERAVDEYLAAGDTEEFSTMEEFLASLDTDR
jgi:hypothetical protein